MRPIEPLTARVTDAVDAISEEAVQRGAKWAHPNLVRAILAEVGFLQAIERDAKLRNALKIIRQKAGISPDARLREIHHIADGALR